MYGRMNSSEAPATTAYTTPVTTTTSRSISTSSTSTIYYSDLDDSIHLSDYLTPVTTDDETPGESIVPTPWELQQRGYMYRQTRPRPAGPWGVGSSPGVTRHPRPVPTTPVTTTITTTTTTTAAGASPTLPELARIHMRHLPDFTPRRMSHHLQMSGTSGMSGVCRPGDNQPKPKKAPLNTFGGKRDYFTTRKAIMSKGDYKKTPLVRFRGLSDLSDTSSDTQDICSGWERPAWTPAGDAAPKVSARVAGGGAVPMYEEDASRWDFPPQTRSDPVRGRHQVAAGGDYMETPCRRATTSRTRFPSVSCQPAERVERGPTVVAVCPGPPVKLSREDENRWSLPGLVRRPQFDASRDTSSSRSSATSSFEIVDHPELSPLKRPALVAPRSTLNEPPTRQYTPVVQGVNNPGQYSRTSGVNEPSFFKCGVKEPTGEHTRRGRTNSLPDDEAGHYARLRNIAGANDLNCVNVNPDGTCFYHAVALGRAYIEGFSQEPSGFELRRQVYQYMKRPEVKAKYVSRLGDEGLYDARVEGVRQGQMAEDVVVHATADMVGMNLHIFNSINSFSAFIEPHDTEAENTIILGLKDEYHYILMVPKHLMPR